MMERENRLARKMKKENGDDDEKGEHIGKKKLK